MNWNAPLPMCLQLKKKTSDEFNVHFIWSVESRHSNPLYICQFPDFLAPLSNCPAEMFVYCMWKICICMSITAKSYNPHYILLPAVFNGIYPMSEQSLQVTNNIQRGLSSQPDTMLCSCYLHSIFHLHIIWDRSPIRKICLEEKFHVLKARIIILFIFCLFACHISGIMSK